jgi:hypothetical protein
MNNINALARHLLSKMGNYITYGEEVNLSVVELHAEVKKEIPITVETFADLTQTEAKLAGFSLWTDEQPDFFLIPTYLYTFLPAGLEVQSVNGEKIKIEKVSDIDNDQRVGCLAYGIIIKGDNHGA